MREAPVDAVKRAQFAVKGLWSAIAGCLVLKNKATRFGLRKGTTKAGMGWKSWEFWPVRVVTEEVARHWRVLTAVRLALKSKATRTGLREGTINAGIEELLGLFGGSEGVREEVARYDIR